MAKTSRKRRTRGHKIAELSVNHVERFVLQCGWTVQRFSPDYGLDLLMTTFNRRGEIENGDVRFQIKATDSIKIQPRRDALAVRLDWRDMVYWMNEPLPVILVVYDAKADRGWWLYLQESLRKEGRKAATKVSGALTLSIPLTNVLDAKAVRRLRTFREVALARIRG